MIKIYHIMKKMKNKINLSLKNLIIIILIGILIIGVFIYKMYTTELRKAEIEKSKMDAMIDENANIGHNDEKFEQSNDVISNITEQNAIESSTAKTNDNASSFNESQKGQLSENITKNSNSETTNSNISTTPKVVNNQSNTNVGTNNSQQENQSANTNNVSNNVNSQNQGTSESTQNATKPLSNTQPEVVNYYTMYEFRTTTCYYCNLMQPIYDKYKNYASNIKFKQIYLEKGISNSDMEIAKSYYQGLGVPDFEFVDSNGNVVQSIPGAISEEEFKSALDNLKE